MTFTETLLDPVVESIEGDSIPLINSPLTSVLNQIDRLPLVLEADEVNSLRLRDDLLIVDVRTLEQCIDGHIPGAVMLEYPDLVVKRGEATGTLPAQAHLSRVLSDIGLSRHRHVVAYNDDNGSHAARLLWTLEILGHRNYSLLNGGFAAWDELDLPVAAAPEHPVKSSYTATLQNDSWADFDYVLSKIGNTDTLILDTRSPEEYRGENVKAARGGHIPGAVNVDWTLAIDLIDNGRLRSDAELIAVLKEAGVTPDKEIIPYCHTHQRSAHTSFVLKHLGFPRVRAYPGSWSEWGNRIDAPIQT